MDYEQQPPSPLPTGWEFPVALTKFVNVYGCYDKYKSDSPFFKFWNNKIATGFVQPGQYDHILPQHLDTFFRSGNTQEPKPLSEEVLSALKTHITVESRNYFDKIISKQYKDIRYLIVTLLMEKYKDIQKDQTAWYGGLEETFAENIIRKKWVSGKAFSLTRFFKRTKYYIDNKSTDNALEKMQNLMNDFSGAILFQNAGICILTSYKSKETSEVRFFPFASEEEIRHDPYHPRRERTCSL